MVQHINFCLSLMCQYSNIFKNQLNRIALNGKDNDDGGDDY